MTLRQRRAAAALAGICALLALAGCGSESPGTPAPAPSRAATAASTSGAGVTEQDASIDLVDAHLVPAAGHRTTVQATVANTDPDRRHDLLKVTAEGARARISGPDAGGAPGRLPLPSATHVDTLAGQYTITLPFAVSARNGAVPVTFTFAGNPGATLALPVLRR